MPSRRGISLGELVLTMSACAVILTLSASLIHRAMHAQSKARAFFDVERSALRLGEQLRRDIHAAPSAVITDGGELQLVLSGDQSIEYRQSEGSVERVVLTGGNVRSRKAFTFPPGTELSIAREEPNLVVVSLVPPPLFPAADAKLPVPAYAVPVSLHIAAVLNRHPGVTDAASSQEVLP